jgi:hypothetical protein
LLDYTKGGNKPHNKFYRFFYGQWNRANIDKVSDIFPNSKQDLTKLDPNELQDIIDKIGILSKDPAVKRGESLSNRLNFLLEQFAEQGITPIMASNNDKDNVINVL